MLQIQFIHQALKDAKIRKEQAEILANKKYSLPKKIFNSLESYLVIAGAVIGANLMFVILILIIGYASLGGLFELLKLVHIIK